MKQHTNPIKTAFAPYLTRVSAAAWVLKLIPIPLGILTAGMMADLVTAAAGGDLTAVITAGILLLTVLAAQKIFEITTGIVFQKALLRAMQKCKLTLYRRFLSGPLHSLYTARHGEIMEHFHDDFSTVTGKTTELLPSFWCALVQTTVYCIFLALQDPWIALILLALSAIQLLPPVIVKKFMEQNYTDCRDIESELTDYTMQAYHGFALIRLYGLKSWWQNGLKALHKEYIRIGNRSTVTGTAEGTMDEFVAAVLKYGSYGILGMFVLLGKTPMDTALEAIALSAGFFGAVKTAADSVPKFAVARTAEERMLPWFAEKNTADETVRTADAALEGVSLTLGENRILEDLTGRLDLTKITLLKGENGAGKSTLLRLLSGMILPDGGKAATGGADPAKLADGTYPAMLFFLPQEDAVYRMTPMELYEMLIPEKISEACEIAGRFHLTDGHLRESLIDTLSGGERKKVFLTLALAMDPLLLFLDEPTNSLDDRSREILCELLRKRGKGALIITHDPVLDRIADMVVTLTKGGLHHEK